MSEGLNRCCFMGNLVADAELRQTSGDVVLNFRLACSESYKDRDGQRKERTEYVTLALWGKRAEALAPLLTKGRQVYAEGSLRTRKYEKDGETRYVTEVNVREVILCGGGERGQRQRRDDDGYAAPPPTRGRGGGYSRGRGAPQEPPADAGFGDDDLPNF